VVVVEMATTRQFTDRIVRRETQQVFAAGSVRSSQPWTLPTAGDPKRVVAGKAATWHFADRVVRAKGARRRPKIVEESL
jgi:hypothetical protein